MFSQFLRPCSRMPNFFIFPHPMRPLSGYFHQGLQPVPQFAGKGKILWHTFRYGFGGAWTLTPMFS